MNTSNRGVKHVCPECTTKYYDLGSPETLAAQCSERIVEIAHRLSQAIDPLGIDQRLALGRQSSLDYGIQ